METFMWGPPLWNLLLEIARIAPGIPPRKRYLILLFVFSLRWVIPCKFCRKHFTENLELLRPGEDTDWIHFVYTLKNMVNQSQGREITLQEHELRTRLATQPQLLSQDNFWFLMTLIASNYPVRGQEKEDVDADMKKHAHAIFFFAVQKLCKYIPHLRGLLHAKHALNRTGHLHKRLNKQEFVNDHSIMVSAEHIHAQQEPRFYGIPNGTPFAWNDRADLVHWVTDQQRDWEKRVGMHREQVELNRRYQKQLFKYLDNPEKKAAKKQAKLQSQGHVHQQPLMFQQPPFWPPQYGQ